MTILIAAPPHRATERMLPSVTTTIMYQPGRHESWFGSGALVPCQAGTAACVPRSPRDSPKSRYSRAARSAGRSVVGHRTTQNQCSQRIGSVSAPGALAAEPTASH
jgi:hypothetical protein